jgi:hypothetical protein
LKWVLLAVLLFAPLPALAQTPTPPPSGPAQFPETWLPRPNVDLTGLDKITTRLTSISGAVGKPMTFGTLQVTVRSCMVRGPDQPADQAAYLDVTDSRDPKFAFHGWMLMSSPGVSVIEHPVYDLRLAACRA